MNGVTQSNDTKVGHASHGQPMEKDFLSLFCEKFHCTQRKFEKRLFVESVYPHGVEAARLIRMVRPGLFKADFALIAQVKHATSFAQVKRLVDFHGAQNNPHGILRLIFKVRISKQRMLNLAKTLFSDSQ